MAKLVRHLTHNQAMRGFDPRSRNEGWQCARTGKTVKHCTHIPLWLNRQSSAPLRRRLQVQVLSGERMTYGAVAQLVRALGRQPRGRRFKSGQSRPVA
jgi:hypothetical protein